MRRGERRKGWRKFWKNDDTKTDEMDRKECRKMMKTNKGRRWKMKKNVGGGVCMKQFICQARPPTTSIRGLHLSKGYVKGVCTSSPGLMSETRSRLCLTQHLRVRCTMRTKTRAALRAVSLSSQELSLFFASGFLCGGSIIWLCSCLVGGCKNRSAVLQRCPQLPKANLLTFWLPHFD